MFEDDAIDLCDVQDDKIAERPWMKTKKFILGTAENVESIMDECLKVPRYALDLETTGLDNRVMNFGGTQRTVDQIVGVCLSPDGERGYYIPLRHVREKIDGSLVPLDCNVPWPIFEKAFRRLIKATEEGKTAAIFHNGKFDQEFLQFWGGEPFGMWDVPARWDDTLILAYMEDTRRRTKGLKALSKDILDIQMIELDELFPKPEKGQPKPKKDFSRLDPREKAVLWYGGGDGICTWLLYQHFAPRVHEPEHGYNQKAIYSIEKLCVAATRWMERNRIHIDREKVTELVRVGQKEWYDAIMDVYTEAHKILGRDVMPGLYRALKGHFIDNDPLNTISDQLDRAETRAKHEFPDPVQPVTDAAGEEWPAVYDIEAPQQLGIMFEEMGVEGLKRTEKSKQIKTSKDELERIIQEAGEQFPFMKRIRRFREVQKALSTYLYPMARDIDPTDDTMRINFQAHKTDTGRFSTPAKEMRDQNHAERMVGWPQVNLQSVPKVGGKDRPECMSRLRETITVRRPDRMVVAIDYSGVELRLVTNLSKEPLWMAEFFHCSGCGRTFDRGDGMSTPLPPPPRCPNCGSDRIGDLHTLTGISVYGKEAPADPNWKDLRGKAKCVHPDSIIQVRHDLSMGDPDTFPRRIGSFPLGTPDTFLPTEGWNVWNGKGNAPILETYNGGEKDLYHIVTRRGILTCSGEHQLALADGTLKSVHGGLKEKDLLTESENNHILPKIFDFWAPIKFRPMPDLPELVFQTTKATAYLAGAFLGDGAKAGTNSVSLCHGHIGKNDKMGVSYQAWQDILLHACQDAGFHPKPKKTSVYIGSRHVMRLFAALGLVESTEKTDGRRILRIPDWILQSGHDGICHFLGGLFDTDGTVGERDGALSATTKDAVFAGQIASMLHAIGVTPHTEACWNKTYSKWYYRVRVSGSQAPLFKPYMKHPGKISRIREREAGTNPPNMVKHIIPAGKMPCCDLHIDSPDHLYWVSGVVSHNSLNFALCYGGGGQAAQRATGVDKNEGTRMKRQFDATYKTLKNWWDGQHAFGRKHGFVLTAFGRKYPVPDITSADGFFRSKAERNAVNGPIQGTSADITKIAMGLIYKEMRDRGWLDKCQMIITMHDELVFEMDLDIIDEAIKVIVPMMNRNAFILAQKWPVPLTSDVEMGYSWAVPWDLNGMTYGDYRFIGNTKWKNPKEKGAKPLPEGYVWDDMPCWPEVLRPFFKAVGERPASPSNQPQQTPPVVEPQAQAKVEMPTVDATPETTSAPVTREASTPAPQEPEYSVPDVPSGEVFEFRLHKPLTLGTMFQLSSVICRSRNSGTRVLRLTTREGMPLDEITRNYGRIMVNPMTFVALAQLEQL